MSISAAVVLFAVCWFMIFFIVLPLRLKTQGDVGEVVPGTPPGAPAGFVVKRKAKLTTAVAVVTWVVLYVVITSGWITVRDFDFMNRMPPLETQD